ncbi:WG repeat-containing protein [Chryseobacterium jejuense]|uniref:WG repeat-containing protein n=1 Tax=Chryseobacterium jejuense TaxID=445960 RepID=UPI001AE17E20|nr:WG repeat-containing protein [Chryseobacterium jejuense]MBP2617789.1 hypothetical protein [Chryseobacterium jejuense]
MNLKVKVFFIGLQLIPAVLFSQKNKDYKNLFESLNFESAYPFQEQKALVCINDHYQYIDNKGNLLPFKFKRTSRLPLQFNFDRAEVYTRSGKSGFINGAGKLVIDTLYQNIGEFGDSLAFAVRKGFYGFMDLQGKEVLPIDKRYRVTFPFYKGLSVVSDGKKYGAINKKGILTIAMDFNEIEPFHEGCAAARKTKDGLWGVIDMTGKFVIEPKYKILSRMSEGLIGFYDEKSEKWGFLDSHGNVVVQPKYVNSGDFHEGLAYVENDKSQIGYIDNTGKQTIDFKFYEAWDFSEGLAVATVEKEQNGSQRNLSGYIDKKGNWVFNPAFSEANKFSDGKALVLEMYNNHLRWKFISKL